MIPDLNDFKLLWLCLWIGLVSVIFVRLPLRQEHAVFRYLVTALAAGLAAVLEQYLIKPIVHLPSLVQSLIRIQEHTSNAYFTITIITNSTNKKKSMEYCCFSS